MMLTKSNILTMGLLAMIGFGIGLHLDLYDRGDMYQIQNIISQSVVKSQSSMMQYAFMSDDTGGFISQATVGFGLGTVLIDPDGPTENMQEFIDNKVTKCIFHTDEDIDEPICIVCKLVDKEIEPCVDIFLDFLSFDDGTTQDDLNLGLASLGITITGKANANFMGADDLFVWDVDEEHSSAGGPSQDDNDIESPVGVGNSDGYCNGCDGWHILIFPDNDGMGGPDPMDDSAKGGTITITFDTPVFFAKFNIADIENDDDAKAIAYSKAKSATECDKTTEIITVPIPTVPNDGDVGTVNVDANNVSCLEIIYKDSGGPTNFDFRCIKQFDPDSVIAKALIELPEGYEASTTLSFEFKEPADIFETIGVRVKIFKPVIDFGELSSGDIIVADDNTDAIIRVDPVTGEQTIISQGGFFKDPENLVMDSDGNILVADGDAAGGAGAIIKVDPVTGDQTILSSNAISTLNLFDDGPEDLVIDFDGDIIVLDDGDGAVIRVNPLNGEQELISDNDEFSGRPEGIALEADGMIIVADGNARKIIRVHPVTGAQTVISSGGELVRPEGVAVAADGSIFVADGNPSDSNDPSEMGKIIKVHPSTGAQTVIIDGFPFVDPSDIEILPNGDLIISDDAASADGMGAIFKVDPITKIVTLISSNGISTLNLFDSPEGLFIVPEVQNKCVKKQGCTPGYWKQTQHFDSWVDLTTVQTVGSVFDQATAPEPFDKTLLEALEFTGGEFGQEGKLLRAAVAAILSASDGDVSYPLEVADIIMQVNAAILSGDDDTMENLKDLLDNFNNLNCPLNRD